MTGRLQGRTQYALARVRFAKRFGMSGRLGWNALCLPGMRCRIAFTHWIANFSTRWGGEKRTRVVTGGKPPRAECWRTSRPVRFVLHWLRDSTAVGFYAARPGKALVVDS